MNDEEYRRVMAEPRKSRATPTISPHQMPRTLELAAAFDRANQAVRELDLSSLAPNDLAEFDRRHEEYVRAGLMLAHWVTEATRPAPRSE